MKFPGRFHTKNIRVLPAEAVEELTSHPGLWLSCDDCFDRSDVEMEAFLADGRHLPADFLAHLRTCAACRQEARTLLELAAADDGVDPMQATTRFDAVVHATAR